MGESKRRRRSAADKLRIVLAGMEPGNEVAAVCRKEGLSPAQYYAWRKQLLGSAEAIFGKRNLKSDDSRTADLEEQNRRLKGVIAEITMENLDLKKKPSR